jgi:serine/threonine-protein kinase ATR
MTLYTVKAFVKAARDGHKYIYQTIPRLLTLWFDLGEESASAKQEYYRSMHDAITKSIGDIPAFKVPPILD